MKKISTCIVVILLVLLCAAPSLASPTSPTLTSCDCVAKKCKCLVEFPGSSELHCICKPCKCFAKNGQQLAPLKDPHPEFKGVIYSKKRLYSMFLNYGSLDARLYNGDTGEKVLFKEKLSGSKGALVVTMETADVYGSLALGITPKALEKLLAYGITTIRVSNGRDAAGGYVEYDVKTLLDWATAAGLDENDELYLTGPEADIMLRNKDGTLTKIEAPAE